MLNICGFSEQPILCHAVSPFLHIRPPHTTAQLFRRWAFVYTGNRYTQMLCFALNHLNKTCAPGQRSPLMLSLDLNKNAPYVKKEVKKKKKKGEALKCKPACPWYPCQFIPPVCQHCHPSVTWRQWWSCLSFGSCGRSSGVDRLLCMQRERSRPSSQRAGRHIKQVELVRGNQWGKVYKSWSER